MGDEGSAMRDEGLGMRVRGSGFRGKEVSIWGRDPLPQPFIENLP